MLVVMKLHCVITLRAMRVFISGRRSQVDGMWDAFSPSATASRATAETLMDRRTMLLEASVVPGSIVRQWWV